MLRDGLYRSSLNLLEADQIHAGQPSYFFPVLSRLVNTVSVLRVHNSSCFDGSRLPADLPTPIEAGA
jgi:hypothetical protein